ncbi:MAG: hypothetical protein NTV86_11135 [Planctomycetota bacterium]|nr:hypothetical protein [Planctomycetota bacterium]
MSRADKRRHTPHGPGEPARALEERGHAVTTGAPAPAPAQTNPPPQTQPPEQMTGGGCLLRLSWMLVGHGVLLVSAILIARHTSSLFSLADAVFWAAAVVTPLLRRVDVVRFAGRTVDGRPATLGDWRRYATRLLPAAAMAGWLIAHAVARG